MIDKSRHEELGAELASIRARLVEIDAEVAKAYGKTNRPYDQGLAVAVRRLTFARAELGRQAGMDHNDAEWGAKAYGGSG